MADGANDQYGITLEEIMRIAEIAGVDAPVVVHGDPSGPEVLSPGDADNMDIPNVEGAIDVSLLLRDMAQAAFSPDPDEFAAFAVENRDVIRAAAAVDARVPELLVLGYRLGIATGSASCMNDLGALYYMGDLVEQDYEQARDLYEMAADRGCLQSTINLGYIYEYGRCGRIDYEQAFRCYALAAALAPSFEATYKLGDMYARGHGVERNMSRACALWERSLELSEGLVQAAQPDARLAQALIDPECAAWGLKPDPLRALALFQQAEIGLRLDIADGQTFYRERLEQVIREQAVARAMLE